MLAPIFFPALCAAALPERPQLSESIGYQINGLIVVFLALALIWVLLEIMGAYFKRTAQGPKPAVSSAAPAPAAAAPQVPAGGLTPELLAVISAAVHVTLGANAQLKAVLPVEPNPTWAHEGRRQIFASHQVR